MKIAATPPSYMVRQVGYLPGKLGEFELHQFDRLPLRRLEKAPTSIVSRLDLTLDDLYLHAGQPDPAGVLIETCQLPAELTAPFKPDGLGALLTVCKTTVFLPGVLRQGEIVNGFIPAMVESPENLVPEATMFVSLIGQGGETLEADKLSQTIGYLLGLLIISDKAIGKALSSSEKNAFALNYLRNLQLS